ncbi:MAG: CRISPR-associated protein Cas4 [Candidatus Caenarcaniphilales bacterium]|nr:CRISPR-associated protein Cas4 [Candidatus Caenarcaniphilales bacterium]
MNKPDYLMLSGIQHFVFCKRQCALIHLEQNWEDNTLTLLGDALHERVNEPHTESRPGMKIERARSIKSERLGLYGKADVVEFYHPPAGMSSSSRLQAVLTGGAKTNTQWIPFPVEYKRGKPKAGLEDKIQLCAQAFCLEETFDCKIEKGALFYGKERRRLEVEFDYDLRQATIEASEGFHEMMRSQKMPPTEFGPKCKNCSLMELCMPETEDVNLEKYLESEEL